MYALDNIVAKYAGKTKPKEKKRQTQSYRVWQWILRLDAKKAQFIKGNTDKLDFIKIKNISSAKDPVESTRRQASGPSPR